MGNDIYSDREYVQKNDGVQIQNMGGFPPSNRRSQPNEPLRNVPPPPPGRPFEGPSQFMDQEPPRSAPPNFIPEAPRGEVRFAPARAGRPGGPGREEIEREEFRGRRRELRRCVRRFTFIWLFTGDSFWFFPTEVGDTFVRGFRWRRNRWVFERIFIRRIFFFRCF